MGRQLIFDVSANTHKNSKRIIKKLIDSIHKRVTIKSHKIIFKTQLFTYSGKNIPCTKASFKYMYDYANSKGFKCTSSIFDRESALFLNKFDVPFVKISNSPSNYLLIKYIPRGIPVHVSYTNYTTLLKSAGKNLKQTDKYLCCVSRYPASQSEYERNFDTQQLKDGVSDHTVGLALYRKYRPEVWEKHLILPDSTGLDAGPFAITPEGLEEIL